MKKKTLYVLSHQTEKVSVMEVYQAVMSEARFFREEARLAQSDETKNSFDAVSNQCYAIASALENTEEINPTKK